MQAGKLNRWITIEASSSTQDAFGQPLNTWVPVLGCWAAIHALNGRELYSLGAGFASAQQLKVTVRYTPASNSAIAAGMRVRYLTRTFSIQLKLNPDERNRELDLICLEEIAA